MTRTILFVDDDAQFLQMVERIMGLWGQDKFTVLTAPSASAALAILQNNAPNLIVIDVCMPVVDGLQFLSIVHRRYPDIQKVALTGFATEAYRTACLSNGAELFLEKPRSPEGLESIFATFDELTKFKPEAGFRGVLRRVGLAEIIQMECLNQSSSLLSVTAPGIAGGIYIENGAIVHAEAGDLTGEPALHRLLALAGGDFNLLPYKASPDKTITGQWEYLLMEAAQKRDEAPAPEVTPEQEFLANLESKAQIPQTPDRQPVRIEELMICSEAGDVLLAWECPKADLRINFLEFISQKARLLRNALPLGIFDRVEFLGPDGRLVAQIAAGRGIVIRSAAGEPTTRDDTTRRAPSAPPSSSPQVKTKAEQHFRDTHSLPGLLAAGLHFPDGSGLSHALASTFAQDALDMLRRSANDSFRVLQLQGFKANRSRWTFAQASVECALWDRGACLALALSRHSSELDPHAAPAAIENFLNAESKK